MTAATTTIPGTLDRITDHKDRPIEVHPAEVDGGKGVAIDVHTPDRGRVILTCYLDRAGTRALSRALNAALAAQ